MKKMPTYACALVLSGFIGYAFGQGVSHLEASIENMNMAIKEAIQCGGGGKVGSGCTGPRGEAIVLMKQALAKLIEAKKATP